MSAPDVVTCRGLTVVRSGRTVVDAVDLTVTQGEWVSMIGPNGAGKTTLLHALAGLLPAGTSVEGEVTVAGRRIGRSKRREIARMIAIMPQRPVVPDGVTVRELIALGRTPHVPRFGVEGPRDRKVVADVVDRLGLGPLADRVASTLSGGELQRAVLGRALAQQPKVLLLDEPTSALDIGRQQQVLDLVEHMRRDDGITVVAAMHDLSLAAVYGERMILLSDGRALADGSPTEVLNPELIGEVYGARVDVVLHDGVPVVLPLRTERPASDRAEDAEEAEPATPPGTEVSS
ncbi:ABC transporter ATP-binding protein [Gordonia phosphorivorans]|uniref:ABC transporter ATP-binding protein n=2 Tax=Gordonia TaxID=2053 RepID=A0ABP8Z9B1_9ACTN